METIRKTTHEIIDEIASRYTRSTRSMRDMSYHDQPSCSADCRYNGTGGKHCAFAHMCVEPQYLTEGLNADDILIQNGPEILKPEYQGYFVTGSLVKGSSACRFYKDCQKLHDAAIYWDENGLSQSGVNEVATLKRRYPIDGQYVSYIRK